MKKISKSKRRPANPSRTPFMNKILKRCDLLLCIYAVFLLCCSLSILLFLFIDFLFFVAAS